MGTLEQLAAMGVASIEGSVPNMPGDIFGKTLRNLGMAYVGGGGSYGQIMEQLEEKLEVLNRLNAQYLCCYWPWNTDARNLSLAECQETADRLNTLGKRAAERGLRLSWHNHDKEFAQVGDRTAFDLLISLTDPAYVNVQLDTYWAAKGGADPETLIKRHPGRIELLHLKDASAEASPSMECLGVGRLDFARILRAFEENGGALATIEHDRPEDGLACVREGLAHLSSLKY